MWGGHLLGHTVGKTISKRAAACTAAARSVSKKWVYPLFRGSNFGQPEVVRSCKELILQANQQPSKALFFLKEKQRSQSDLAFRSKSQPSAGKAGLHE